MNSMSRVITGLGALVIVLGVIGAVWAARATPPGAIRVGLTTAAGLGGAFAGAVLLGLGAIIDRLDLLTGRGAQRAAEPAPPPVTPVTCPSCGERQDARADRPHHDCVKCGRPVIRDWVYLGRHA
ncbi:hypothetical protein STH2576 [Symbiobacterium thermophilum IAM 14863]|uniref:Uncharacterized protein n=2 Tax=Symbiobacterium thermophilum TaxID=2734 RepID=Q67L85_SYMTH|nr:hypothetical protein STH2576 [Symbiobacterium thermophilum IAM 14863]